jgi:hypothetical protein
MPFLRDFWGPVETLKKASKMKGSKKNMGHFENPTSKNRRCKIFKNQNPKKK